MVVVAVPASSNASAVGTTRVQETHFFHFVSRSLKWLHQNALALKRCHAASQHNILQVAIAALSGSFK